MQTLTAKKIQDAWHRTVIPFVRETSPSLASVLKPSWPLGFIGNALIIEFPQAFGVQRLLAEEDEWRGCLAALLYELTGTHLLPVFIEAED